VPADDFTTPKEANTFGDICAQIYTDTQELGDLYTAATNPGTIELQGSEDCLFLNVYTPKNAGNTPKPVMVWIHGGAFLLGSGSNVTFNPTHIVDQEKSVAVTLNYRLGIYGFLNLPDAYKKTGITSGNFGLQDQALALKWVHDNIALFGGDPAQVTIVGESAGSMSVGFHLTDTTTPTSGYFRGAVMQSPYMGFPIKTASHAEQIGSFSASLMLAQCLGQEVTDPMQCLYETMTTEDIAAVQAIGLVYYLGQTLYTGSFSSIFPYEPYIDGEGVQDNLIMGQVAKPLLIGNNRSESNIFLSLFDTEYDFLTEAAYIAFVADMFRDLDTSQLLAMYPFDDAAPLKAIRTLVDDYAFKCPSQYFIAHNAPADTYFYKFNFESSFNRWQNGATCDAPEVCHAADIPYTFDQFYFSDDTPIPNVTDNERAFSQAMITRWGGFIDTLAMSGFIPYDPATGYVIDINNTAPYFYQQSGTFSAEHHCDYWGAYYEVQPNP
jgi:para-nitrobenzyl esterase